MRFIYITVLLALLIFGCTNVPSSQSGENGRALYMSRCVSCHGADGRMGLNGAIALPESTLNLQQRINVIENGRKIMPAFGSLMSPEQIEAVANYTLTIQ